MKQYNKVLIIAGSDSGGGAGIQADIKTVSACGSYATTSITAITVQNTIGVEYVHPQPVHIVTAQIEAVLNDIGTDAIKIGMLHSEEIVNGVSDTLRKYNVKNVVLDPVMAATSGESLFDFSAIEALKNNLMPIATIITPNIPEAEILLNRELHSLEQINQAAYDLSMDSKISVLIKGGHLEDGELLHDILYDATRNDYCDFISTKIETINTHGTGCALSSAIAAYLSQGFGVTESVTNAKTYINGAIAAGSDYKVGSGHGPIHHFYTLWKEL